MAQDMTLHCFIDSGNDLTRWSMFWTECLYAPEKKHNWKIGDKEVCGQIFLNGHRA